VATGVRDAAMALAVGGRERVPAAEVTAEAAAAAFVCTGTSPDKGAHAVALYEQSAAFRDAVDTCLARAEAGSDARAALTAGDAPAAALAEYATARLLRTWGVQPAALVAAGPAGWRAAGCLAGTVPPAVMLDPHATWPAAPAPGLPLWSAGAAGWSGPEGLPPAAPDTLAPDTPAPGADPAGDAAARAEAIAAALHGTAWAPLDLTPDPGHPPGLPAVIAAPGRAWLAGLVVDWEAFHATRPFLRTALPTYPFQRERYWYDGAAASRTAAPAARGGSLREQLAGRPAVVQAALITEYLRDEIGRALGPQPTQDGLPDPAAELFDLNAESLMLIELTAKLGDELGHEVPATGFIDYPTIDSFVENLFEELRESGFLPE
jgi:acyl transferase domain-containing protein